MKKYLPLLLTLVILSAPLFAFADDVPLGGSCSQPTDCVGDLTCTGGKCAYDTCPGGSDDECPGAQTCNKSTLTCTGGDVGGGTAVTGSTTPPAGSSTTSGTPSANNTSLLFVPLTNIPGINSVGNSGDLSAFLNNIYRICIGLAAVIAVLQFIRAGLLYMLEGGFMEKKEAKSLMMQTLTGLFLVLSPVIVFGIINPKILTLQIGVSNLGTAIKQPPGGSGSYGSSGSTTTPGTCTQIANGTVLADQSQQTCCSAQSGCTVQSTNNGGTTQYTCSCSAGAQYAWRGAFYNSTSPGALKTTLQQGPFSTQQACYDSSGSYPAAHGYGGLVDPPGFTCTCNQTTAQQGSNCSF